MTQKNSKPAHHIEEKRIEILDRLRLSIGKYVTATLVLLVALTLMAKGTKSEDGLFLIEGVVAPAGLILGGIISCIWQQPSAQTSEPDEDETDDE